MRKEYYFNSSGNGRIHVCRWEPEGTPLAVFQIVHGVTEYAERYEEFASFLVSKGFLVVAEDHMGHGRSENTEDVRGYFHGGWFCAVQDSYQLLLDTRETYPDIPYILFGFSMGSFMVQTIVQEHPNCQIDGLILCGSGWQTEIALRAGMRLSEKACQIYGEKTPCPRLQSLLLRAYNLRVERPETPLDWMNRVRKEVQQANQDPLRCQVVTAGLARDMLIGISHIQQEVNLSRVNKKLPVFLASGGDDPVGTYGEGVRRIAKVYSDLGMESVSLKIFPLCRHEIIKEINKKEVFDEIYHWVCTVINKS